MHWIYLLSSDTKWDDLYIFKLEVNPLWQRDKEVTWGSPFWENLHRNNCFVKFRYEFANCLPVIQWDDPRGGDKTNGGD